MIKLSTHALEEIGYKPIRAGEPITAAFHMLVVYKVTGFALSNSENIRFDNESLRGVNFTLMLGNSVNELSQDLSKGNFVKEEDEWAEERGAAPPYVMVHIGPTEEFSTTEGYWKRSDEVILTYFSFDEAQAALQDLANRLLPTLLSSLTVRFSKPLGTVAFEHVDRTIYGITPDGVTIRDLRVSGMLPKVTLSRRIELARGESLVRQSLILGKRIDQRAAEFFHLGLEETDPIKKFLYFFLSMEIYTHTTFKKVKHSQCADSILTVPTRVRSIGDTFFANQQADLKNVGDRFTWCAICKWDGLEDDDVRKFKELLKLRNDIAHGNAADVPPDVVKSAQALASKILRES